LQNRFEETTNMSSNNEPDIVQEVRREALTEFRKLLRKRIETALTPAEAKQLLLACSVLGLDARENALGGRTLKIATDCMKAVIDVESWALGDGEVERREAEIVELQQREAETKTALDEAAEQHRIASSATTTAQGKLQRRRDRALRISGRLWSLSAACPEVVDPPDRVVAVPPADPAAVTREVELVQPPPRRFPEVLAREPIFHELIEEGLL
jgi:hypothetical protein